MPLPLASIVRPAVAVAAVVLTIPAASSAATSYSMQPCTTGTVAAATWTASGPLVGTAGAGVECTAASGEPSPDPARGNRGVFVLPQNGPVLSTSSSPYAAWTLSVPASVAVTGGSLNFRGGTAGDSWRSYLTADGTTIAGCWPNASSGVDACSYSTTNFYFARAATVPVPAGSRSLSVGLRCSPVDGAGRPQSGCTGSNPSVGNDAYAAVVGGTLTLSDGSAPTGSATLTQVTPRGEVATWSRSADAAVRLTGVSASDVGRGVCALRLDDPASGTTSAPIRRWTAAPNGAAFHQCDGVRPDELVTLAGRFPEGERTVTLTAADSTLGDDGNRTALGTVTIRTDDTAPTISYPSAEATVDGNTRAKIAPSAIADALSGVQDSSTTATMNGARVDIAADGTVFVPAGGYVSSVTTATDRAGNSRTASYTVYGRQIPTPPTETTPATPTVPTTPTTPNGPTPTVPTPAPTPVPAPKPTGCAAAKRSSVTTAKFAHKTRRLTLSGCRYRGQKLRVQVQLRRTGKRAITRTFSLSGRVSSWTRTIRTRSGETPRKARLALTSKTFSSWRAVK